MDFRISANLCLCASVTVARLYGRTSSVPKPGIHMFQFLSKIQYICVSTVLYIYILHNLVVVHHDKKTVNFILHALFKKGLDRIYYTF